MGQVWSKADFDGIREAGHHGGTGSVLAVTAQNPGPDEMFGTSDDVLAPLNSTPISVSIDNAAGPIAMTNWTGSADSIASMRAVLFSSWEMDPCGLFPPK